MLRWAGKPARVYQNQSSNIKEQVQRPYYKPKPKSNEIAAFTKLHSLKQGDMPLSEFIRKARRLAELCNYLNNLDRQIRDMIVSGIQSLRAYQKCIDSKDLSLQDCINICQAEDAIRMQVLECSLSKQYRVHRLQSQSTSYIMDPDSLQTPTGTGTRLHIAATIVGHKTGPGFTLRYARLRPTSVVGVERRDTLIHYAEALGHPYTC